MEASKIALGSEEVATHASLVNARLSNVSLNIVELFISSKIVVRDRNRLGDRKLGGFFSHLDGDR